MSQKTSCNSLCVVKHATEQSCPFRHVQCPFVQCTEKIAFQDLINHLWKLHKLLQFPTDTYQDSFKFSTEVFSKNFALRPFLILFEDRQFVLEICRKNDTGLWHMWVYLVGALKDVNKFECLISISSPNNRQEITYRGPVVTIDSGFASVVISSDSFVVPDSSMKRFGDRSGNVTYKVALKTVDPTSYNVNEENSIENFGFQTNFSDAGSYIVESEPVDSYSKPVFEQAVEVKQKAGLKNVYPDSHKVFVGNLPPEIWDPKELIDVFEQYGKISDVFFFKNSQEKQLQNRAQVIYHYAFVVFTEEQSVARCLLAQNHQLKNGHKLFVAPKTKEANNSNLKEEPKTSSGSSSPDSHEIEELNNLILRRLANLNMQKDFEDPKHDNTIFVGNIPHDKTKEDIWSVFSKYGQIDSIWIDRRDQDSKSPVGRLMKPLYGFVKFSNLDAVMKCLQERPQMFPNGHRINVELKR